MINGVITWVDVGIFVLTLISVIVTSILTILIIFQTAKNTKREHQLNENISDSQKAFNELQLKLQQREDKKQAYLNIVRCICYNNCLLGYLYPKYKNTPNDIEGLNEGLRKIYKIDIVDISTELELASIFVSKDNKDLVKEFAKCFKNILSQLAEIEQSLIVKKKNVTDLLNEAETKSFKLKELSNQILKSFEEELSI